MDFLRRHKITLAAALGILLLAVSLLVDTLQTVSPSIGRAKRIIERKLHSTEARAESVIRNGVLLNDTLGYSQARKIIENARACDDLQLYIYKDDALTYWSTNAFIPDNIDKLAEREIRFLKEGNGFYEVLHKSSADGRINIYALIPVYYQYSTSNKYLRNGFVWEHPFLKRFIISSREANKTTSILDQHGNYLFSIRITDNIQSIYNPYVVIVEIIGLILLFWSMYQIARQWLQQKRYGAAFALILGICLLTDLLFSQFKLFSLTKTSLLFSSNLYASAYLGKTLGSLLVRCFLLSWSLSLLRYIPAERVRPQHRKWLIAIAVALFFLLIFIIESVIQNSVISFNFYLVNTLDKYTFISLLIFGLTFSGLFFLMSWIFENPPDDHFFAYVLLFGLTGLLPGILSRSYTSFAFPAFLIFWLLTFFQYFRYERTLFLANKKYKFISNLILLSLIAFLTSVIVIYNTNRKEIEKRKYRMEELVSERDIGEEYSLIESEPAILQDNFIRSYFKNPYLSNVDVDKRIAGKYYRPFLKRYSIMTYAFDKDGMPLIGISQKDFSKLNNVRFYKKAKSISDHFYYLSFKENGEKYMGYFPILDDSLTLGYLFVEFIPKIFSSYSAYPELLLRQKNYYDEEFDNFSYAIYDNKYLVKQRGDYEYQVNFNFPVNPKKEFSFYQSNGYNHMIYSGNDKQVVLSEKNMPVLSTLSVFSYMVIFFLLFFIVMDLLGFSERFRGEDSLRSFFSGNTLQKQIQNSMIALVLFSLAIIGIVTMIYFQYQYNIYQNSRLLKKVNTVMKDVTQYYLEDFPVDGPNTFEHIIQRKIKVLSAIHALDINVYSNRGELLQSSQPEIFKRSLLSSRMDAEAYYNLIIKGKSKYVHDESIGKLDYLSAYQPFRSNGKVLGYFNFPYYGKQKSFEEDISYFLVALVNVYVLFLIAAALLAVFLSRSITNSLSLIAENIRGVQLGKNNQPISWKNDDEIGLLVKQYNLMLAELEKSADLLARSEREGAWREMAKQVAHEIKNPLTPMKLSIQHLQRALKDNSPDVPELTEKISQRLIEQIDNLSNIATAFSDFARMPQGDYGQVDIIPILISATELFREMDSIGISLEMPDHACYVKGDKEQLMRVFINILKNATQAIPEQQPGKIDIAVEDKNDTYVISIKDNGVGIANEKRTHIFEPNFTTKTSGTGLGLAISKNIVERMNGNIRFESEVNAYTIFYIELPKYQA